ncbi:MAG TPA: hypothetical protein PKO15_14245, partial [Fibrobacteria bacterium]|nr:hypothetical protein [Fibrobacteria bacterium]
NKLHDLQGNAFHWVQNEIDPFTSPVTLSFSPLGSSYLSHGKDLSQDDLERIKNQLKSPEIGFRTILPLSASGQPSP